MRVTGGANNGCRQGAISQIVRRALMATALTVALACAFIRLIAQSTSTSPMMHQVQKTQAAIAVNIIAKLLAIAEPALADLNWRSHSKLLSDLQAAIQSLVKLHDGDVAILRKVGIIYGYLGIRSSAAQYLTMLIQRLDAIGESAKDEIHLWRKMLSEKPIESTEIEKLESEIEALNLGWFEQLAKAWLYEKAFMLLQSEMARLDARSSAANDMLPLLLLIGVLVVLGLVGVLVSPIALIASVRRVRESKEHIGEASSELFYLLIESFAIYLFIMEVVAPRIIYMVVTRCATSVPASLIVAMAVSEALASISVIWLLVSLRLNSLNLSTVGLKWDAVGKDLLHGFFAYIALLPWMWLASVMSILISRWFHGVFREPIHPVAQVMMIAGSREFLVTAFSLGVIIAPLIEEIVFRGALYGALRMRFGVLVGAISNSFMFSLLHPQSIVGIPPLFVIGVGLSLLYEMRRSIIGCAITHALINLASLIALAQLASQLK